MNKYELISEVIDVGIAVAFFLYAGFFADSDFEFMVSLGIGILLIRSITRGG